MRWKNRFGGEAGKSFWEFYFGDVVFEMPESHPSEESKRQLSTHGWRSGNWEFGDCQPKNVFKTMGMDEIHRGEHGKGNSRVIRPFK